MWIFLDVKDGGHGALILTETDRAVEGSFYLGANPISHLSLINLAGEI